jgi:dihydrodipicolinate synthase/N-acetylneuraminate lyase
VTPFDNEGEFSAPAFERLLERVFNAGAHGV